MGLYSLWMYMGDIDKNCVCFSYLLLYVRRKSQDGNRLSRN